jgi:hypothetical protein
MPWPRLGTPTCCEMTKKPHNCVQVSCDLRVRTYQFALVKYRRFASFAPDGSLLSVIDAFPRGVSASALGAVLGGDGHSLRHWTRGSAGGPISAGLLGEGALRRGTFNTT